MSAVPNVHHDYGIGSWSISHIIHKKRLLPSVRVLLILCVSSIGRTELTPFLGGNLIKVGGE